MEGINEALQYLVGLGNPDLVRVDERPYSALSLKPIKDPEAISLTVHTLMGLVDYINSGDIGHDEVFIQVVSPVEVNIHGLLRETWKQRECFLSANIFDGITFRFGEWYDHEQFVINLQSNFVQDEITAQILRIVGNISDNVVRTVVDDGVSQGVHVKTALRPEEGVILNPVELAPYRTFPEVEQPKSKFILRLKSGKGELPQVALFDADGGLWKLEAIKNIKVWLAERLPEMVIIA